MRHLEYPNLALVVGRQGQAVGSDIWDVVFVTDSLIDQNIYRRGGGTVLPLYLYPGSEQDDLGGLFHTSPWEPGRHGRIPNLEPQFASELEQGLGLTFLSDGAGNLRTTFGPEDILHYIYAVFHSSVFRTRFAEFLRVDFPRVPVTADSDLFGMLAGLGADLTALHLMNDEYPTASWNQNRGSSPMKFFITTFVERKNSTTMGKLSIPSSYEAGKVYLDTRDRRNSSYFAGVPEEVWEFHIGGYQVCHKWLYDRRETPSQLGRTLTSNDILHYQRLIVAIKETIRLTGEIEEAIERHGGWPLPGTRM